MKTSVEITLMPLNDNYKEIIKNFIKSIRNEGFEYGDFGPIMEMLIQKIKTAFMNSDGIMINLKIVKGNRINYKVDF